MSALTVVAIVCFSVGSSAGILGTMLGFVITAEVNRKKDDKNQIPYSNLNPWRRMDVFSEYRRLYPRGRLHIYMFAAFAVTALGVFGALLCVFLLGPVSGVPGNR